MTNSSRRALLSVGLALCGLGLGPAYAETPGFRATAIGGLDRTDAAPGAGSTDGFYFGGQLGLDWNLGGVIAGAEGELAGSTASAPVAGGIADHGLFANAAVRLAVPLSDGVRVFARGGYAYHAIDYGSGASFSGSGYTAGAGGDVDVSGLVFLRGEYRFSDFGSDVRGQQFLGGIGIRF